MSKTVTVLSAPLVIPKEWKRLLALHDLGDAPKAHGLTPRAEPEARRCDVREVQVGEGGLVVVARLCSGDTNYWLEYEVTRDGELIYEDADVDHDVAAGPLCIAPGGDDDALIEVLVKVE